MKLSEIYPEMSNAHRKFAINSLLASFEYILEVGEDGVCQALVDDGIDASMFGNVARRIEEFRATKENI